MARLARVVVPRVPHHVTQRGNRREPIFFEAADQEVYRDLLAEQTRGAGVEVWAYCLMPNHVHLILTPADAKGLGRAVGEAHRRYTNFVNARGRWTGHLFQSRFASVVMDEAHLIAAARYVALNPVRARLVARAEDWPWSSVRAHLAGQDDALVTVRSLRDRIGDFAELLRTQAGEDQFKALRAAETTGRLPWERGVHRRPRAAARAQARPWSARPCARAEVRPGAGGSLGIGMLSVRQEAGAIQPVEVRPG